jgi:hypothetical protein
MNKKQTKPNPKSDSAEPYFYMGIVLKGTEKQYLNLLKYINGRNGSKIIYQCKSLTYLRVTRDDRVKLQAVTPGIVALESTEAET